MAGSRARCAVEAALLEFLRDRGIPPDSPLVVGFSGGPDSTALLAALAALGRKNILAVHVDHGIRPRAELEAELAVVKAACAALGSRLTVARVREGAVESRARAEGCGIEAAARAYRRAALQSAMRREGASAILLAHTGDDQAETVLMRLLGGSGAGGLRGIPEASGPFLRPFLGMRKAELLEYLKARGLAFSIDSTNASRSYLRNRLRLELLPLLDSEFPGWRRGVARARAKASRDEEALAAEAEAVGFSSCGEGGMRCIASRLLGAADAVAIRAIVRAAGQALGVGRLSSDWAAEALKALRRGEGATFEGRGLEMGISGGEAVLRRSGTPILRDGLDFPRRDGYFVSIESPCRVRIGKLEIGVEWTDSGGGPGGSGIREGAFSFPIIVRSRRPGDAIAMRGGTKRLDELFAEWRVTARSRAMAPIVEDRDGIVAVLGSGFGGKDRFRAPREECESRAARSSDSARRLSVIVKGA